MRELKLKFKIQNLRKRYPKFLYKHYSYRVSDNSLEIFFYFQIEPDIYFNPKIIIENVDKGLIKRVGDKVLDNLIFHLGLMEIPSYWKAACSPEIEIKAGYLNEEQIKWWKDLIMKGMGQFFYENQIDFRKPNFLKIKVSSIRVNQAIAEFTRMHSKKVLVPVGGGKDSVVTLELLKRTNKDIRCFSLNPTDAALKIMKIAGCKKPIIIRRKIDEKLLELNRRGFLNGHTPFSAYLAFLSVFIATIYGLKYIAFSNERSSNEGNVKYLGRVINHQWSKSFEFEQKFRKYSQKYLTPGVKYFSFLRPLYEIQIVKLFSRYPKYFSVFLSCNVAYQTASGTKKPIKKWCGNCSKCLFIFATLYPFLNEKRLLQIFSQNLLENKQLLPVMQELIGERKFKPFECVGTKKESLVAFYLSWKKAKSGQELFLTKLPFLLRYFEEKILPRTEPQVLVRGLPKYPNLEKESKKLLNSWNSQNNLSKEFEKVLFVKKSRKKVNFVLS